MCLARSDPKFLTQKFWVGRVSTQNLFGSLRPNGLLHLKHFGSQRPKNTMVGSLDHSDQNIFWLYSVLKLQNIAWGDAFAALTKRIRNAKVL